MDVRRSVLVFCCLVACRPSAPQRCAEPIAAQPAEASAAEAPAVAPTSTVVVEESQPPEPVVPERQRFEVTADDGHVLAVWAKIPPEPTGAIVFLHGRTWSSRPDFDVQVPGEGPSTMEAFAAEGFATYALDLRGYGDTPRDATGWNTPDRATKDLLATLAWVREREGRAPALLGWSLGSLTAQLAAQREPDAVEALVLYGYPRAVGRKYRRDKAGEPARAPTTAKAAASDFIIPGNISAAASDAFVEQALAADPVRSDWNGTEQWNELDPGKVEVPTLVIHGAKDPYAPVANQTKLLAALGTADKSWVVVSGGDHAAHLENVGSAFNHAVLSFLGRPR